MGNNSEGRENPVVRSLRQSHNELREQLEEAETDVERAQIRGQRHGLLKAIAVCHHHRNGETGDCVGSVPGFAGKKIGAPQLVEPQGELLGPLSAAEALSKAGDSKNSE